MTVQIRKISGKQKHTEIRLYCLIGGEVDLVHVPCDKIGKHNLQVSAAFTSFTVALQKKGHYTYFGGVAIKENTSI